jgi:hypothetical protein
VGAFSGGGHMESHIGEWHVWGSDVWVGLMKELVFPCEYTRRGSKGGGVSRWTGSRIASSRYPLASARIARALALVAAYELKYSKNEGVTLSPSLLPLSSPPSLPPLSSPPQHNSSHALKEQKRKEREEVVRASSDMVEALSALDTPRGVVVGGWALSFAMPVLLFLLNSSGILCLSLSLSLARFLSLARSLAHSLLSL